MSDSEVKSARYEVLVVGAGPAGVSAAINVANRNKQVAIIDVQRPFSKPRRAGSIPNYPGFTYASGEELGAAFIRHLAEFRVPLLREKVSKIQPGEDEFVVFTDKDMYHADAVILATGVYREAELEGEERLVGRGVSYCVSCDGRLFSGKEVAVIGFIAEGEEEASSLADDIGCRVTYIPLYSGEYRVPAGVRVLPRARPRRLSQIDGRIRLELPGEELVVDGVFIYKSSVAPRDLLDGLNIEGSHIVVNRFMETSMPGVFAAGDCTGEPYQIAKAVGEGQVAALQAVRWLREREHPRPAEPAALKPEDRQALSRILRERMVEPVRLVHFTQLRGDGEACGPAPENCREARRLLEEFASLSPQLILELRDFVGDSTLAGLVGVTRIPATLVAPLGEEQPRVRFYGVPAGYEFGALLDDVLDLSAGRLVVSSEALQALGGLRRSIHLEVMATPACPYCPAVIRLAHCFAASSPMVSADAVAISEFPELAQRYQVRSVPLLVMNGTPVADVGLTEATLLDLILKEGS